MRPTEDKPTTPNVAVYEDDRVGLAHIERALHSLRADVPAFPYDFDRDGVGSTDDLLADVANVDQSRVDALLGWFEATRGTPDLSIDALVAFADAVCAPGIVGSPFENHWAVFTVTKNRTALASLFNRTQYDFAMLLGAMVLCGTSRANAVAAARRNLDDLLNPNQK